MIQFYASEAKYNSIIAYGDTHNKARLFKITYKNGRYHSFKKSGGKYFELAISQTLPDAQRACIISLEANEVKTKINSEKTA